MDWRFGGLGASSSSIVAVFFLTLLLVARCLLVVLRHASLACDIVNVHTAAF